MRRIASSEVLHPPQDSIAVLRGGSKGLYIRYGTLVKQRVKGGDLATDRHCP
jgi:hypothetical protein